MGTQKQQCPQHVPVPTTDYSVVITTLFHKPITISAFIVNSTFQWQTDKYTGYAYTWQNTYNHFCVSSYYKRCYNLHIWHFVKHTHTDSQSKNADAFPAGNYGKTMSYLEEVFQKTQMYVWHNHSFYFISRRSHILNQYRQKHSKHSKA